MPQAKTSPKAEARTPQQWCDAIRQAQAREKHFRKNGKTVIEIFEGAKSDTTQFNILYSNTETLQPALYNATPRPVVQRRFRDEDPLGAAVAKVAQRTLEFSIDPAGEESLDFDEVMSAAVLDALLPGRGVTRFKYETEVEEGGGPKDASTGTQHGYICVESVPWDRFCHGYARKWKDVEWICFEHLVSKHERDLNFPELTEQQRRDWEPCSMEARADSRQDDTAPRDPEEFRGVELFQFFEIWHRPSKRVMFCTPQVNEWLKEVDDPFQLELFYPIPQPLRFVEKVSSLTPTSLYTLYEKQAEELNTITLRINKLTKMLKVRGGYDSSIDALDKILSSDDGTMTPIDGLAKLYGMNQKLDNAIWIPEITEIIQALQVLYNNREACKQTIYEITGLGDIIRGVSVASETATAQKIKDQWGTLRLRRMQKKVQAYVRDSLRMIAELAGNFYDVEDYKRITNLQYPTEMQKQQAQFALQSAMQSGQQVPPDPQLQEMLQTPSWEQITQALSSHLVRAYKIDIETNSTVDAAATEDKQDISELLNAMAQFMSGVAPLVESGGMSFDVARTILLTIVRRYRFGTEVEDSLRKMQAPQPKDDGKAKAEMEKMQMEMQQMQAQAQIDSKARQEQLQLEQEKMALERERMDMDRQKMEMEMEVARAEHQARLAEIQAKTQATLVTAQAKVTAAHAMPKKPASNNQPRK